MNHIKIFENINIISPEIGDYVICEELYNCDAKDKIDAFLPNNIGQIVAIVDNNIQSYDYLVHFDYVPENIKSYFYYEKKQIVEDILKMKS